MITTLIKNLNRASFLLNNISDKEYSNTSIAPYYSSIGGHVRHIMDVYTCVFEGLDTKHIDLTARKRNSLAEEQVSVGLNYIEETIQKLSDIPVENFEKLIRVTDDLGDGKVTASYTLASVLIQAHSHAIHHYASIGYIIYQLGIELPDADFGMNPTTPKKASVS